MVVGALAALFSASVSWLAAPADMGGIAPAFAETASATTKVKEPSPQAAKEKPKAKKSRTAQKAQSEGTKAAPSKAQGKSRKDGAEKPSAHATPPKGKKSKKTASRTSSKKPLLNATKSGEKKAPPTPCFGPAITVDRGGLEAETFPFVDCTGAPLDDARQRLSVLARPWGTARPSQISAKPASGAKKPSGIAPDEIAPGVRLLDRGLVRRLDKIARKFPGKALSLVSGYRPQSRGSLHQSARAVDLRVTGVINADLAAFCRTITDTGCGYYPNSSFVHVDARLPGTGPVSWIDASGPGEPPRYVTHWPPAEDDPQAARVAGRETLDSLTDSELGDPSDQQVVATSAVPEAAKPVGASDPKVADPKAAEPKVAEPKVADPKVAELKPSAPRGERSSGPTPPPAL